MSVASGRHHERTGGESVAGRSAISTVRNRLQEDREICESYGDRLVKIIRFVMGCSVVRVLYATTQIGF